MPQHTSDDIEAVSTPLRQLGELTRALLTAATVDGVLRRVSVATRYLIPAADLVSITVRHDDGRYSTPAETDEAALELDRVQYQNGEGPCVDAAEPSGAGYVHSADLAAERTWPRFAPRAAAMGYASVSSVALLTLPDPSPFTGALNIYSRRPGALSATDRDMAFLLATHASLALASAHMATRGEDQAANLRRALTTRTVIGQATGIIMARRGLTADEAFAALVRASQRQNVKLATLATLMTTHPEVADRL